MIQIMSSNGEVQYGVNDYVIDFDNELNQIVRAEAGSTAYSIESGTTFIKDNSNNWNIFTNNSGGGGTTPELPDNILQIYEMSNEEFWDNYNTGNLGTGLYEVTIEDGLIATSLPIDYKLNSSGQGIVTNDNYGWILSYEDLTLLQINDVGEIVKIKKLTDLVSDRDVFCTSDQKNIIIDNSNYLYIGSANEEVFAVNINDIENSNNWNIINPNITNSQDVNDCWNFSIISSYCDSTDFLVLDGGTFAYKNYDSSKIAYFKNGNLITQIENIPYAALSQEYLMVSNYATNKFYRIYFEGDYNTYTGFFKLYEFNIDGTYTSYTLNNTFTFNESDINFSVDNTQMFIRNDILYIQFIINNTLYLFLFDTVTNNIIQEEQIYSPAEGDQVWYYNQSKYNDLYHDLDFSVSCLRYNGWNELIGNSFNQQPFFIKITYKDEASYVELLHLNNYNVQDFSTVSYDNIFHSRCNKNGQYLYADVDNKFHLFSFKDFSDTVLSSSSLDILSFRNQQLYPNINDGADFIITAYDMSTYDIGFIRINATTGNIISASYDQSTFPNENIRSYMKDKNIVLYGDLVINLDTLKNDYNINSRNLGKPLTQLNNKQLFYTEKSINYLREGKILMSQLVHKNNIILTKNLEEKQI